MTAPGPAPRTIAYFSMEIAVHPDVPTYSGGLGVLAGDTIRSAADLGLPAVAVTLVHRGGYFTQSLAADGSQTDAPVDWDPADFMERLPVEVDVELDGRFVRVGAWRYDVMGHGGAVVPVLMLDTDHPDNTAEDRAITERLYGGDDTYRVAQETILGIGGVRMLEAAGHDAIDVHHMNEGHASLLVVELLRREAEATGTAIEDPEVVAAVRERCVFTTHTPVEAGHDRFPMALATRIAGDDVELAMSSHVDAPPPADPATLNMTELGMRYSRACNGVARRHGSVSRAMFPGYAISSITNGVHAGTWVAPAMAELFDETIPDWRDDPATLRNAIGIPTDDIRAAHRRARVALLDDVLDRTGVTLDPDAFTIGFARRATAYKRADLVLSDPARLRAIAETVGPIQIVYGGKAHPRDLPGQAIIRRIHAAAKELGDAVRVVYVQNYEMDACARLIGGSDIWLNTPRPPMEASGTSGMKAAMNGVPSLSTPDGWWVEGCIEGVTGWAIGRDVHDDEAALDVGLASHTEPADVPAGTPDTGDDEHAAEDRLAAAALFDALESTIVPMFHREPDAWANVMRQSIAINGSWFHTHRMVHEYVSRLYIRGDAAAAELVATSSRTLS